MSAFDRFSIPPLLIPIARDFHAPLATVATAATLYFLLYGITQPLYGLLSDHFGRVPVMRWSLVAVCAGSLLSLVAPTLPLLIAARLLTGAAVGAMIPASLVYIGDRFPFALRQRAITDISAATASGTALGVFGGGVLATYLSWRAPFAITAFASAALAIAFRSLPEPGRPAGAGGPLAQVRLVLASPWAAFLIAIALAEGVVFNGLTTFFAPALQSRGISAATAGLVVAGYGVATLIASRAVRRLTATIPAAALIGVGGALLGIGYFTAGLVGGIAGILVGATLAGGAFAFMHSTLQTWITEVVPRARGTATALFAGMLFLGAAFGAGLAAQPAQQHRYAEIFLAGAVLSLLVGAIASAARHRYHPAPGDGSGPTPDP
ncbi:MAG: hypothetical protein NVS9B1_09980 [Candidatus Dormibacteraceae bacterium]